MGAGSSSESAALPQSKMDQYTAHILRADLYPSWLPGRISSVYSTILQGSSGVGGVAAATRLTRPASDALTLHTL